MTYRPWQDSEVELLRNSASESFVDDLAEQLDRPVQMVRYKLKQLGLTAKDKRSISFGRETTVWTEQRLSYLRGNALTSTARSMASMLGLTEKQVRQALEHYGIAGRGRSRQHSPEEVERRIETLRGVEKTDRNALRECPRCHENKPVFQYPSEMTVESRLCEQCRKEVRAETWAAMSPEAKRKEYLRKRTVGHGITPERYAEMLEEQDYACAVCHKDFPGEGEGPSPAIDHDHAHCDKRYGCAECVRGLLCIRCNLATGWAETFNGSPEYLEAIAHYLAGHSRGPHPLV